MTNLSPKQQELLDAVQDARERANEANAAAYEQYLKEKWVNEADLRAVVKAAIDGKVPIRKIGFVIGSSDHKTVKNLAENSSRKFSDRL